MHTWIEVNPFALIRNVRAVREAIGEGTALYAVVKANAYGHGLELASDAFWRAGVDGFVVTECKDALFLAEKYPRTPVVLLTPAEKHDIGTLVQREIRLVATTPQHLSDIQLAAQRHGKQALVHLEIETGMNRLGMAIPAATEVIRSLSNEKSPVHIEGMFTHIYHASDREVTERQAEVMRQFQFDLQQEGLPVPYVHVFASESLLGTEHDYMDYLFDGVRFGRMLYGAKRPNFTTEPALTWKTQILAIHRIQAGETVGYNATYTSDKTQLIATLPVGYADGLDRKLSNKGFVLIGGKRCPIVGEVCMSHTMVDASAVFRPQVGDEVVLLGKQDTIAITAEEMAEFVGTIDYEILARLSPAIPRMKTK
ncbi:MAG TPA: alanine racemase [Patescibacteria group bacterium]